MALKYETHYLDSFIHKEEYDAIAPQVKAAHDTLHGGTVGVTFHALAAETGQHEPPVSVHHGQFWAAVRQHQQGIGIVPYLRFKGVIGQFVAHDGAFAVAGSFLNVLVCVDLS